MEMVPTSPQSRLRAQRPEAKSGPGVGDVEVELVRRAELGRRRHELERLAEGLVVHERGHVGGVEEGALARALRLGHRADHVGDEPVALGVALLADAGAEVGRAVAVHVLAVHRLGDLEILVPGGRGLQAGGLEHVGPVVHHVEVTIEGDHVGLVAVLLREVAEEGADVLLLDGLVGGDARGQVLEVAAGDVVDHPLRREDRGVDRVGAGGPVGQHLLVELDERHADHVDLGAGQRLELGRAPLQRLLDGAGLGHHVDGDPVELAGGPGGAGACEDAERSGAGQKLLHCCPPHRRWFSGFRHPDSGETIKTWRASNGRWPRVGRRPVRPQGRGRGSPPPPGRRCRRAPQAAPARRGTTAWRRRARRAAMPGRRASKRFARPPPRMTTSGL